MRLPPTTWQECKGIFRIPNQLPIRNDEWLLEESLGRRRMMPPQPGENRSSDGICRGAANRYLLRHWGVADYLTQQPPTEIGEPTVKMLERTFEVRGPEGLGAKPRPELIGPDFSSLIRLRPDEESAFRRILGSIPAEESDEVFVAAVEAFSCMANQSEAPSPDPA